MIVFLSRMPVRSRVEEDSFIVGVGKCKFTGDKYST
jgi:hypothetical protein